MQAWAERCGGSKVGQCGRIKAGSAGQVCVVNIYMCENGRGSEGHGGRRISVVHTHASGTGACLPSSSSEVGQVVRW